MLLLDKSGGMTSHDVVARVRRIVGERRVGHAGTLDPMATGLLIVAVGPATRLLRFVQAETKRYVGTIQLGVATNTLDADGTVVARAPVPNIDEDTMAKATATLTGPQQQVPPMVSAIKIGGERLYDLARRGVEVDRPPRSITVESFHVTPGHDDRWDFDVVCSTGTYVRVLASDLAQRLGTLGHLTALRRTAIGVHDVSAAMTLEVLEDAMRLGRSPIAPARAMVQHLASVTVEDDVVRRIVRGQRIDIVPPVDGPTVAALDRVGELVAVLGRRGDQWQPEIVFAADTGPGRS
ncbi:MAG: tRNA pseudouridine(55) synthase TruB [Acidimicrobiales bacterium]